MGTNKKRKAEMLTREVPVRWAVSQFTRTVAESIPRSYPCGSVFIRG